MSQAKKKAREAPSKADFVRSVPSDMPGMEVVEKAKEAGITLSAKQVATIRAKDRARARASGSKKSSPKKGPTKSAFVLGFPMDMPARDVVAKAASRNIVLTEKHVAAIRSDARKKSPAGAAPKASTGPAASAHAVASLPKAARRLSPEELLRAAVLAVGLPRATELIADENRKLRALLDR